MRSVHLSSFILHPLALAILATLPSSTHAENVSADAVNQAIERGVDYLKREQRAGGGWDELRGYPYGQSALATLALLNAGVKADDPHAQKALDWLRGMNLDDNSKTYVVALQTMALCAGEPTKDLTRIEGNVRWLEETQLRAGVNKGGWGYPGNTGDNSNSIFAMLALYEAAVTGIQVKEQTWKLAHEYWQGAQNADGSWGYKRPYVYRAPGTGSMTCAGISALCITMQMIGSDAARIEDGEIRCCELAEDAESIERGLSWLGENFSVENNPSGGSTGLWNLYYLVALQRAASLSGRRTIGDHDWFQEGLKTLLPTQDLQRGFWRGRQFPETDEILGTSLALAFVAGGQEPVVIGRLDAGKSAANERHEFALANLTAAVRRQWKQRVGWRTFDLSSAASSDLASVPVLLLSGEAKLELEAGEKEKLREYIASGGLLLAEERCPDGAFHESWGRLMKELFPAAEHQSRPLPHDHLIPKSKGAGPLWEQLRLSGIVLDGRIAAVYSPRSLSCFLELASPLVRAKLPDTVAQQVDASVALGIGIVDYATKEKLALQDDKSRDIPEP